jgi:hypothetical protein
MTMSFSLCTVIAEGLQKKTNHSADQKVTLENTIKDPGAKIKIVYTRFMSEFSLPVFRKTSRASDNTGPSPKSATQAHLLADELGAMLPAMHGQTGCSGCTPAEPYPPSRDNKLNQTGHGPQAKKARKNEKSRFPLEPT